MDGIFFPDASLTLETLVPGKLSRKVRAQAEKLMMVEVFFEAGAEGSAHEHPHEQVTYCIGGRFSFTVGDETRALGPGDSVRIPGGVRHGTLCHEKGRLLDVFAPRRDDFLKP